MTTPTTIDKAARTLGQPQYHIRLKPGDVGDYVLLPGDPDRVLRIGDLVITTDSMKNEGTSSFYVPAGFPAVPDHFLTHALYEAALDLQKGREYATYLGLSVSDDAFYGETPEYIQKLHSYKVLNAEMESPAIFTVAHLRDLKAAMVCAVSGNLVTDDVVYVGENTGLIRGREDAIDVALEGIYRDHQSTAHA